MTPRDLVNQIRTGALDLATLRAQAVDSPLHQEAVELATTIAAGLAASCSASGAGVAFLGTLARILGDGLAVQALRLLTAENVHPAARKEAAEQLERLRKVTA